MGKKRIAIVGEKPTRLDSARQAKEKKRAVAKTGKEHGRITDMGAEALAEAEKIKEKEKELEKIALQAPKKAKPKVRARGRRYLQARLQVDRHRFYPLPEAIKLLKKVSIANFNASVDVHLVVRKEGLKGTVDFPNPTGKKQVVRIADEKLLSELEKGKINFTGLVATPPMMSRLTKYAKLLGPRGLMPNPKAGTITDKPEQLVKKMTGSVQYKTEPKAPLIHITIGNVDSPEKQLEENFRALISAVGRKNIKKAVLASTMGPGIKVDLKIKNISPFSAKISS